MSEDYPQVSMTLKQKAVEVMAGQGLIPTPELLENMPLEELKLETDARAGVLISLSKRALLTDEMQDVLVNWLNDGKNNAMGEMTHIEIAEHFVEKAPMFFNSLIEQYVEHLENTEAGAVFLADLDVFRNAYFSRSPAAENKEKQYESTQMLMSSGFKTGINHIRALMDRQDAAAIGAGVDVEGTEALISDGSHLAIQVSKMSLADEERYFDVNNSITLETNPVIITDGTFTFSSTLFTRMRALKKANGDDPQIAHRPHLQCPASISFPGDTSFNTDFWTWYNGALTKAGFWEKQKIVP